MSLPIVGVFLLLGGLGMPLAFALGFAGLVGLWLAGMDMTVLPQRMMHSVNSFPLMAIPLFMLAGELMLAGGIMTRLIALANAVVGRVRGGLAHVTIISGTSLSAVSGAAVADASALGIALMPSMRKFYSAGFGASLIAASANLAPIIPPSGAMIVYALMAGSSVSIGGLFMAGVLPGIILAVSMLILSSVIAWARGYPPTGEPFSLRNVFRELSRSFVVVLMPIVVIGGIVGGAFTATEGAAVAVVYALAIGFFVTRELRLSELPQALYRAAVTSSIVIALIAFSSVMSFIFTIDLVPMRMANALLDFTSDPNVFIALVMLLLLFVGMFVESNAAYIMLAPLLAPIALKYGVDPLFFGFLFVFNLVIGMMTPPVGVLLFVMCGIANLSMGELLRHVWPFIVLQYCLLLLCWKFPAIVLTLPRLLGY